jgi:hypothetical protein
MSWIVACCPAGDDELLKRVRAIHGPSRFERSIGDWYIACGGPPETTAGQSLEDGSAVAFAGISLRQHDGRFDLDLADKTRSMSGSQAGWLELRCDGSKAVVTCDTTGLRTAYVTSGGDKSIISSRLDWISRMVGANEMDYHSLGSHWRCHNQLSWRSLVRGIERMPPGGRIEAGGGSYSVSEGAWRPDPTVGAPEMEAVIRNALHPTLPENRRLTLGLSGGLDSRVLAAVLEDRDAQLHTFGTDVNLDVSVAERVGQALGRKVRVIHQTWPDPDEMLEIAKSHAASTNALAPASAAMSLRHYQLLRSEGYILVDGGFGEIGRRQFMNRLLASRKGLAARTPAEIALAMRSVRADVFAPDVEAKMKEGVLEDVEGAFTNRPQIEGWSDADQADLVAVRYRLPNFFGMEQARLDGEIPSYMPFATPAFLDTVFATPVLQRAAGRLFKKIVRDLRPEAARLPLVKGTTTYPFSLSPLLAYAFTRAKTKLGLARTDELRASFLQSMEPFVRDMTASARIREAGVYDLAQLDSIVSGYYAGDSSYCATLDWWLAFELWRQSLEGK